ncbi:MAG TPA: c-type cytochrome [Gemmatimonadales bacterium]|nr:c-type cytochrome [Gemmatimonadales bacterium]
MSATSRGIAWMLVGLGLTACGAERPGAPAGSTASGAASAGAPAVMPASFGLGRAASEAEIKAWDIDVNPTGATLPAGRGTWAAGQTLYAEKCAACHGAKGEGMPPVYPKLIGADPRDFSFADDFKKTKTIGNYWPYATTLYDYINRAMPLTQPGSLQPDEVYALVAYLLAENQVIGKDAVMDATSLPAVVMPGRDHFVPDDRSGGPGFK